MAELSEARTSGRWERRPVLAREPPGVYLVPIADLGGGRGNCGASVSTATRRPAASLVVGARPPRPTRRLLADGSPQPPLPSARRAVEDDDGVPRPRAEAAEGRPACGLTRDLERRVQAAKANGVSQDLTVAAEQILTLAAALNAHDRKTRGHSERVRALTDLIADELKLPTHDRDRLRWSALLHDIGKLSVHPEVLNKSTPLEDAEWEMIRNHPLEGAKLTAPLAAWLGPWADTIAQHHEWYDGSGYPYGLHGKDLSYGARIVAVADSYDAMTAIRSYSKKLSPTSACAELTRCAGTQFDPAVVRAFLQVSTPRLRFFGGPLGWLGALPYIAQGASSAARVAGVLGAAAVVGSGAIHTDFVPKSVVTTQRVAAAAPAGGSHFAVGQTNAHSGRSASSRTPKRVVNKVKPRSSVTTTTVPATLTGDNAGDSTTATTQPESTTSPTTISTSTTTSTMPLPVTIITTQPRTTTTTTIPPVCVLNSLIRLPQTPPDGLG